MRWVQSDLREYFASKEYIDTALVPLVKISFSSDSEISGNDYKYIQLLAERLEQQLKGRILLLPALVYFNSFPDEQIKSMITSWKEELLNEGFRHIFFLSTDSTYLNIIADQYTELLYVASIPLTHLEANHLQSIIDYQIEKLWPQIINRWQSKDNRENNQII